MPDKNRRLFRGDFPVLADLNVYFWVTICSAVAVWIAARFYIQLFRNCWELAKLIGRRLSFYFAWFSFLRRRKKIERFQALADRLWRRNQAREVANRNVLPVADRILASRLLRAMSDLRPIDCTSRFPAAAVPSANAPT